MNRDIVRQFFNIFTFILTLTVNGLANALPLNNLTTGEISDRFSVYFVPASYVFSIWGLIYLLLAGFTIYQALPSQRENPVLRKIGYAFVISNLFNTGWIFFWHYELFPLTLLFMLGLLGSLVVIVTRLGRRKPSTPAAERWLVRLPFSVYLGWITVATVANVTSLLDYLNWNGWGVSEEAWMAIILGAVVIIAGLVTWSRQDSAYLLVLLWALVGIVVKHAGVPAVVIATWIATGIVAMYLIWNVRNSFFQRSPR